MFFSLPNWPSGLVVNERNEKDILALFLTSWEYPAIHKYHFLSWGSSFQRGMDLYLGYTKNSQHKSSKQFYYQRWRNPNKRHCNGDKFLVKSKRPESSATESPSTNHKSLFLTQRGCQHHKADRWQRAGKMAQCKTANQDSSTTDQRKCGPSVTYSTATKRDGALACAVLGMKDNLDSPETSCWVKGAHTIWLICTEHPKLAIL